MRYEWDPTKAEANQRKHGIQFADAVAVFSDEMALTSDDPYPDEERYVTIGIDAFAGYSSWSTPGAVRSSV